MADVLVLRSAAVRNTMSDQARMVPSEHHPPASSMGEMAGNAVKMGVPVLALLLAGYAVYTDNQGTKQQQKDLSELGTRIDDEIRNIVTERTERIMQSVNALEDKLKLVEDAHKKSTIEIQTLHQQLRWQEAVLEKLGYPSPMNRRGPPRSDGYDHGRYGGGSPYDGYGPPRSDDYGYPRGPSPAGNGYSDGGYPRGPSSADSGYGYPRSAPPPQAHEHRFDRSDGSYPSSLASDIANI